MSDPTNTLDDQIRAEIERIVRDVVDLEKNEADPKVTVNWKPRTATNTFSEQDNKRLVPADMQVYYDLQLSRGASRPVTGEFDWTFDSPESGAGKRAPQNAARLAHFSRFFPVGPRSKILDIGVRDAQLLYYLKTVHGYENLSGVDCVKLNVLWCQKNGFDVTLADAHELSQRFAPASFDVVFAYHVIEHCFDPNRVLREIHTILRPGGGVHLEIPISGLDLKTAHCYSFQQGELLNMAQAAGFRILNTTYKDGDERIAAVKEPVGKMTLLRLKARAFRLKRRTQTP